MRELTSPHRLTDRQLLRVVWIAVAITLVLLMFTWAASAQETETRAGGAAASVAVSKTADDGSSPSRSAKSFGAVTAGYLTLSFTDFYLSNRCIQGGRCVEIGSYRGIANHPTAFLLAKTSASSALAAAAWSIRKKHPRAAWGVLVGLTAAQAAVVTWNLQQGRAR